MKDITDAELATYYYEHRDDADEWSEPEPLEQPERLDVTISVRFTAAEIAALRDRAEAAGFRVTAYIRRAALQAEQPLLNREKAMSLISEAGRVVGELAKELRLPDELRPRSAQGIGRKTARARATSGAVAKRRAAKTSSAKRAAPPKAAGGSAASTVTAAKQSVAKKATTTRAESKESGVERSA